MLAPEIKEIQRAYKGDRVKQQAATRALQERGSTRPAAASRAPPAPPDPDVLGHQPGPHAPRPDRDAQVFGVQLVPGSPARPLPSSTRRASLPLPQPDRRGPFHSGLPRAETTGGHSRAHQPSWRSSRPCSSRRLADGVPAADPADDQNAGSSGTWPLFAADLDPVRHLLPAGLFIYLIASTLYPDRPAVPDHRLGRHVPALAGTRIRRDHHRGSR